MQYPQNTGGIVPLAPNDRAAVITVKNSYGVPGAYGALDGYPPNDSAGPIEYFQILRRHKLAIFFCAIAGAVLGYLFAAPQTPVYQTRTSIEIQDVNPSGGGGNDRQFFQESQPYSALPDIQTQIRILQSDSLADRTIAKLDLPYALPMHKPSSLFNRTPQRDPYLLLRSAAKNMKVRSTGDSRIIDVVVDSTNPQLAAQFANTLANEYIDQNMESHWEMTQRTGEWLSRQLEDMRVKLERSEYALQQYAQQAGLVFTGANNPQGRTSISEEKLLQIQQGLATATADRIEKESRYRVATSSQPEVLPDVMNDQTLRQYRTQLTELRRQVADLSTVYTPDYTKLKRLREEIKMLETTLEQERTGVVDRIKNEFEQARLREQLLLDSYTAQARTVTGEAETTIRYQLLKHEADSNRQLYEAMLQRVKEAGVAAALKASNIRIVDPARVPVLPYRPNIPVDTLLGLILGSFSGFGLVLMRERTDRSIKVPGTARPWLNVPELGAIPNDNGIRKRVNINPASPEFSSPMMSEAYRVVLTSILLSPTDQTHHRLLVVTSSSPAEGKTTVATNLAVRLSNIGKQVLLVDADLARPRLHELFGIDNHSGLTTILRSGSTDMNEVKSAVHQITPNLFVLPAGPQMFESADLLFLKSMSELLTRLKEQFEMVVIDTPPTPQTSHARVLGRLADGVIVVIRAGQTTRDSAVAVVQRLYEDGCNVLGTVLNKWNPKTAPSDSYGRLDQQRRYDGSSSYV